MAILAGFAAQFLVRLRPKTVGISVLGLAVLACLPALAVERPWEYHNILGGGLATLIDTSAMMGLILASATRKIADYCRESRTGWGSAISDLLPLVPSCQT